MADHQDPKRERTDFGFIFGAANVSCLASDKRRGVAVIGLETAKHSFQFVVSKTGRVRIYCNGMDVLHG